MASIFSKLNTALKKSSSKIQDIVSSVISKNKLTPEVIEELEDFLITTDLGVATTEKIIIALKEEVKKNKQASHDELLKIIGDIIYNILVECESSFALSENLNIILVCGVNGNGKTTTIGKLARWIRSNYNKKIMFVACDVFRAAAEQQLKYWGDQNNCDLYTEDAPAATIAYNALKKAKDNNYDVVIIDTAGRLNNQINLMLELEKINNVIYKQIKSMPEYILQIIDSTTGQHAITQVNQFKKFAQVNGLIVTKIDSTAKAGVIVSIASDSKIPIYFLGTGEKIDDLVEFNAREFSDSLIRTGGRIMQKTEI